MRNVVRWALACLVVKPAAKGERCYALKVLSREKCKYIPFGVTEHLVFMENIRLIPTRSNIWLLQHHSSLPLVHCYSQWTSCKSISFQLEQEIAVQFWIKILLEPLLELIFDQFVFSSLSPDAVFRYGWTAIRIHRASFHTLLTSRDYCLFTVDFIIVFERPHGMLWSLRKWSARIAALDATKRFYGTC